MREALVQVPKTEAAPRSAEIPPAEQKREAIPAVIAPELSPEEKEKISILREALLEAGGVSITPIEGNPFKLSEGYESTGPGVTVFHPDGRIEKKTFEQDAAERRKGMEAARYFSQSQRASSPSFFKAFLGIIGGRIMRGVAKLWSKFMGAWGRRR